MSQCQFGVGIIDLYPPQTPLIQSSCNEQVSLIQFFTEAASTLGFWFGLSIIAITQTMGDFVKKLVILKNGQVRPSVRLSSNTILRRGQTEEIQEMKQTLYTLKHEFECYKHNQVDLLIRNNDKLRTELDKMSRSMQEMRNHLRHRT